MKCQSCSGKLEGNLTICPYCGVKQEIDLKSVHFRDLGCNEGMPCPDCQKPLDVIEFELEPPLQIEKCGDCLGMFFNPGELEALLEAKTSPLIWLDKTQLDALGEEKWDRNHDRVYHQCPICSDRMHHVNFGGKSGVILDQCGTHGVWLDAGELRQLKEWWRAGGRYVYQENEAEKARAFGTAPVPVPAPVRRAESSEPAGGYDVDKGRGYGGGGFGFDNVDLAIDIFKGLVRLFR